MKLMEVLEKVETVEITGQTDVNIQAVTPDSRQASAGSLFVAVKGITTDGHKYIDKAISDGAKAIVCEKIPQTHEPGVCYVRVKDPAKAMGTIASNFFGNPSKKLKLIGVTGTNGKTTVVRMLYDIFTSMGHSCGLISTTGICIAGLEQETTHTTPDVLTINRLLSEMAAANCQYAFMEVSSHALVQKRTAGIVFEGAVFTNISHDHLDYHKSFKAYINAKKLLFKELEKTSFALTNLDDKNGLVLTQNTVADVKTYSLRAMAYFKGKMLENSFRGLHLRIDNKDIWSKLSGRFNAYNILAVYGVGRLLGKQPDELLAAISNCEPPEGRFDLFTGKNGITGIVDYAHTPDAIKNVLENINEIKTKKQKLFTVIGCGGNRDKDKRPIMAMIAAKLSDYVLFTSDNPRFEDPEKIIEDMIKGLEVYPALKDKYIAIPNRQEAIKVACITAASGDIILVAGKGHEKFQEIKGETIPFDDKKILKEFLTP